MTDAHLRMCSKFGTETEYPRRQAIVAGGKSKPETGKIPVPGISAFGPVRDTLPVQKEPAALIRAEIEDEFLFTFRLETVAIYHNPRRSPRQIGGHPEILHQTSHLFRKTLSGVALRTGTESPRTAIL